ncbi:MAG: hypothetical protein HDR02_15125 [Lachnospiraceae bacterium]|nr:hypothetical protein [Lachnospiraceae bacterium]
MSKSILQDKRGGECYLCKLLLGIDTPVASREEHHIMHGTANRRLSEHYGLKVYLCPYHHRTGPEAVHRCQRTDTALKEMAQRTFEKKHSHEKWMEVFGRNYLSEEPGDLRRPAAGTEPDDRHGTWQQAQQLSVCRDPAATCKNQQNKPFSQINISQNTPAGFCFLELPEQDPGKEGP